MNINSLTIRNMQNSTATLKSAVVETYRETLSAEERMDGFLDLLNEAKAHYSDLNKHWENLNLQIESHISSVSLSNIDDSTFLLSSLEGLLGRADSLLAKIKGNRVYYQGIKAQIDDLEENIELSREFCEDIKIKIDPQMIELGTQLDNL
jgi:hypothetical protein